MINSTSSSSSIASQPGRFRETNEQTRPLARIWTRITSAVRTNSTGRSDGTNGRRQEAEPARSQETGNHGKRAWIRRNAENVTTNARTLVGHLFNGRQAPPQTNTASQPAPELPPQQTRHPKYRAYYGRPLVSAARKEQTFAPPKEPSANDLRKWARAGYEMQKIWEQEDQVQNKEKLKHKAEMEKIHDLEIQIEAEKLRYMKSALVRQQTQTQDIHNTSSFRSSDGTEPFKPVLENPLLAPELSSVPDLSRKMTSQNVRSVEESSRSPGSAPNEPGRQVPEKTLSLIEEPPMPRTAGGTSEQGTMTSPKNMDSVQEQTTHAFSERMQSRSMSSVSEHDGAIERQTEEDQLQIARNRELDIELMQLRTEFAAHEAEIRETPTTPSDPSPDISTSLKTTSSVRSALRDFKWSQPLQTIASADTSPQLPVPSLNLLPYSFEMALKSHEERFSLNPKGMSHDAVDAAGRIAETPFLQAGNIAMAPTTEGMNVNSLQNAQSRSTIQFSGDPAKPTSPYMEGMSKIQQESLLQDLQNFRRGYYDGLAGMAGSLFVQAHRAENTTAAKEFRNVQNFFGTLYPYQDTASMQAAGPLEEPRAFVDGYEYGLVVGRLHMPTADMTPKFSDITTMFHANWNHQVAQAQQVQPGAVPSTTTGTGSVPAVASFSNPIVVLQAPTMDAPIALPQNPPTVQVDQNPVHDTQVRDPRFPFGTIVSSSFQQPSAPATVLGATPSNDQPIEYF